MTTSYDLRGFGAEFQINAYAANDQEPYPSVTGLSSDVIAFSGKKLSVSCKKEV